MLDEFMFRLFKMSSTRNLKVSRWKNFTANCTTLIQLGGPLVPDIRFLVTFLILYSISNPITVDSICLLFAETWFETWLGFSLPESWQDFYLLYYWELGRSQFKHFFNSLIGINLLSSYLFFNFSNVWTRRFLIRNVWPKPKFLLSFNAHFRIFGNNLIIFNFA